MTADDDLVREMRRNASFDRGTGCNFCGPGADAIEARDAEIAALRQVVRRLMRTEPAIEPWSEGQQFVSWQPRMEGRAFLDSEAEAIRRAWADTEGDPQ